MLMQSTRLLSFPLYLGGSFHSNYLTLPSNLSKYYLVSHKPFDISSSPSCHKKVKNDKSTLTNCLHCLILFVLEWCVYVVYLYILGWYGEQRLLLREVKEFKLQKGK
jgi:hypothetical protein